jgi:hypothetical protein
MSSTAGHEMVAQVPRASDALRACAAMLEDDRLKLSDAPGYILLCEAGIAALRRLQLQLATDYTRAAPERRLDLRSLVVYPTPAAAAEDDPR